MKLKLFENVCILACNLKVSFHVFIRIIDKIGGDGLFSKLKRFFLIECGIKISLANSSILEIKLSLFLKRKLCIRKIMHMKFICQ